MVVIAAPAAAIGGWTVVPNPNPSVQANCLTSAVSISAKDAWAVGTEYQPTGSAGTLAEHWDGTQWTLVASPNPSTEYDLLIGVTGLAGGDIWAVGQDESTLVIRRQDA